MDLENNFTDNSTMNSSFKFSFEQEILKWQWKFILKFPFQWCIYMKGMLIMNIQVTKLFNENSGTVLVNLNSLPNVGHDWFLI